MKKLLLLLLLLVPFGGVYAQAYKLIANNGAGVVLYLDTTHTVNIGYGMITANLMAQIRDSINPSTGTAVTVTKYTRYKIFHDTATWRVLSVEDGTGITPMNYQTSTPTDFYRITADSIAHFVMKQLHLTN